MELKIWIIQLFHSANQSMEEAALSFDKAIRKLITALPQHQWLYILNEIFAKTSTELQISAFQRTTPKDYKVTSTIMQLFPDNRLASSWCERKVSPDLGQDDVSVPAVWAGDRVSVWKRSHNPQVHCTCKELTFQSALVFCPLLEYLSPSPRCHLTSPAPEDTAEVDTSRGGAGAASLSQSMDLNTEIVLSGTIVLLMLLVLVVWWVLHLPAGLNSNRNQSNASPAHHGMEK